jgi:hypothetical protein
MSVSRKHTIIKIFIIIAFLANIFEARGQNKMWGNPTKIKGAAIYSKVLEENAHGVFLLRYANANLNKYIVLEKYSLNLNLQKVKNIDLKKQRILKIKCTQKGILLIIGKDNKVSGSMEVFGLWYDYDLNAIGDLQLITKLSRKEVLDIESVKIRVDENRSLIAISNMENYLFESSQITFSVFDFDFKKIYNQGMTLPKNEGDFYINDFVLAPDGKIMALLNTKSNIRNQILKWYSLNIDSGTSYLYKFPEDKWFKNLYLSKNIIQNKFVVSGFYGLQKKEQLLGYFFYTVDLADEYEFIYREFSQNLFDKITMSKIGSRKNSILDRYEILQIIPRTDGGIMIIAEQKSLLKEDDVFMNYGIPQVTARNIFQFDDILILNLDDHFNEEWSHVIHKNQTTVNDGGYNSSIVIFVLKHFIQIFYNDPNSRNGEVLQYTFFWDGNYTAKKAFNTEFEQISILPNEATQVSSNKIIIPTVKNRKFALLKLVFE